MRGMSYFENKKLLILVLILSFIASGCLVRTYNVVKDRPDQEVSGNQGYLMGKPSETKERQTKTRKTYVVEVEIGKHRSPQEENLNKETMQTEVSPQTVVVGSDYSFDRSSNENMPAKNTTTTYVVKKGDTLEKIAARPEIYDNKKKWYKIYKANKDKIKNPDKILSGQVLQIPE